MGQRVIMEALPLWGSSWTAAQTSLQGPKTAYTPLHLAEMVSKDLSVFELLLDRGADINASEDDGSTPLHFAIRFAEEPAVIELLLDSGADINARAHYGSTSLHLAVELNKDLWVSGLLLDRGADIDASEDDVPRPCIGR